MKTATVYPVCAVGHDGPHVSTLIAVYRAQKVGAVKISTRGFRGALNVLRDHLRREGYTHFHLEGLPGVVEL